MDFNQLFLLNGVIVNFIAVIFYSKLFLFSSEIFYKYIIKDVINSVFFAGMSRQSVQF